MTTRTTRREEGHRPGLPGTPSFPTRRIIVQVATIVATAMIVADQATKELAERVLVPGVYRPLFGDGIGWMLTRNDGGAFSVPLPWWVFLVVTVVVVILFLRSLPEVTHLGEAVGFGLLLAGALGNGIDRVVRPGDPGDPRYLHGHVIDFVAWGSWPRFNLADTAITLGFVLLLWSLWRTRPQP
ncbi:MAG: signal peptidase II [Nitriliruptorales bacterium]|nr:signal peptidase II [Nitriliruptorales bacterium]